jgi:hypothetical protein
VTVDGGTLDYNGHAANIGNLTLLGDGHVTAMSVNNTTTTVASGTLTAGSIVCDSLIIGVQTRTDNIVRSPDSAAQPAVENAAPLFPSDPVSITAADIRAAAVQPVTIRGVAGKLPATLPQFIANEADSPVTVISLANGVVAIEEVLHSATLSSLEPSLATNSAENGNAGFSAVRRLVDASLLAMRTKPEKPYSEPNSWDATLWQAASRRVSAHCWTTRFSALTDEVFGSVEFFWRWE